VHPSNPYQVTHEHLPAGVVPFPADEDELGQRRTSRSGRRPPRRRRRLALALALVMVMAAVTSARLLPARWPWHASTPATPKLEVIATVPYWNLAAGSQSVLTHREAFAGASPWIYGVNDQGGVVSQVPAHSAAPVASGLTQLSKAGVPLMPTISNTQAGSWDSRIVERIITEPRLRDRHVQAVVALVERHGYAGVDIDYENLPAKDRAAFSAFIVQLAAALHARGKELSVDVFAKATNRGYDQRNLAQDYAAIGSAADQVRIMAYDLHWSSSAAGPVAPLNWVSAVLAYALTQIPKPKIVLGVPMYGYDWVGSTGTLVSWLQAYQLARTHDAGMHWDRQAQAPWFSYVSAQGQRHTVWFENAYSSSAKIALARKDGVGGVYLWLAGDEDDLIWKQLPSLESEPASSTSAVPTTGSRQ
jgi:spore germination protein